MLMIVTEEWWWTIISSFLLKSFTQCSYSISFRICKHRTSQNLDVFMIFMCVILTNFFWVPKMFLQTAQKKKSVINTRHEHKKERWNKKKKTSALFDKSLIQSLANTKVCTPLKNSKSVCQLGMKCNKGAPSAQTYTSFVVEIIHE